MFLNVFFLNIYSTISQTIQNFFHENRLIHSQISNYNNPPNSAKSATILKINTARKSGEYLRFPNPQILQ